MFLKFIIGYGLKIVYFPVKMLRCKQVTAGTNQRSHHQRYINIFFEFTFFLSLLDQLVIQVPGSFFSTDESNWRSHPVIYHLLPGE